MRVTLCLIGGMLMAAAMPAQAAKVDYEAKLAKALEGRVAGEPVNCIPQHQIQSTEIFDHTAILYKLGSTWYVNRPDGGATFLDRNSIMVTDTHSTDLCNIDIVRLVDNGAPHFQRGSLGLGKFVPYKKPKTKN